MALFNKKGDDELLDLFEDEPSDKKGGKAAKQPKSKPAKEPKEQKAPKPKKERPARNSGGGGGDDGGNGGKGGKSKLPLIIVGVVLVVAIAGFVGFKVLSPKPMSFQDTFISIFRSELGTFRYVFSVETGDQGTVITAEEPGVADISELESMAAGDSGEMQQQQTFEFQDWDKYSDVQTGDWKYPIYQLIVEGCTTSLEPLTTHFTVTIATPYANQLFTEITCFQGNYYVDIESMRTWLLNSKDTLLTELGNGLPQGSKWLVIPEDQFVSYSRYAEEGEKELSKTVGLVTIYRRFLTNFQTAVQTFFGAVDPSCFTGDKETANVTISPQEGQKVLAAMKSVVSRPGDFYSNVISSEKNAGLYTDDQYTQALREKDNVMDAWNDANVKMNTVDLSTASFAAAGTIRKYVDYWGNDALEGGVNINIVFDGVDYKLSITGLRSGRATQVELPTGSQLTFADLSAMTSPTLIEDTLNTIGDYFNFTSIRTNSQLELNPTRINREAKRTFIDLVNSLGFYDGWLTEHNLDAYLQKYTNYEQTSESTEADLANAQLVSDFYESLNSLTGGLVQEKVVEQEEEVEKYPELTFSQQGIEFDMTYNEEESSASLIVVDCQAINKSEQDLQIDCTRFSLHTLLDSIYPANEATLLYNNDNSFDTSTLTTTLALPAHQWAEFKLYFVVSSDGGHMDLFVGDNQVGVIVEY